MLLAVSAVRIKEQRPHAKPKSQPHKKVSRQVRAYSVL